MGKALIIKGANFASVAVGKETVEPKVYIELAGTGAAADFGVGDYYISNAEYGKIYHKTENGYEAANIEPGTILKYQDYYFEFKGNDQQPRFTPYEFNLEDVTDFTNGAVWKLSNGEVSLDNSSTYNQSAYMSIQLSDGDTLVYNTRGGNSFNGLIIDKGSGNIEVADSRNSGYDIMIHTAEGNETAYINTLTSYLTNGAFVCKAK